MPEEHSIHKFIRLEAASLAPSSRILDAGAGHSPYRQYFEKMNYEATDFPHMFDRNIENSLDFICDLSSVPRPDNTYDAIINTQVLEHVPDPAQVLSEFHRILKPGGILLLSAPQGWGLHGEPYHFFNFTSYGLDMLFRKASLDPEYIKPRGGIFLYLAERVRCLPRYIFDQHSLLWNGQAPVFSLLKLPVLLPLFLVLEVMLGFALPCLLSLLDPIDCRQAFTLGYACRCRKKGRLT